MDPMMMGGMMPPQDPMAGGMGGMDPQLLAALMATMGGGAMPSPEMPGGGMSMEESASFSPGTGGTTPMTMPNQPIPDTAGLGGPDSSSLLQSLMAMAQGGATMGGMSPVGGMY